MVRSSFLPDEWTVYCNRIPEIVYSLLSFKPCLHLTPSRHFLDPILARPN